MSREEEFIYYNGLFDLYGNLLTEREKEIFSLFYEEDFSLQEIAETRGVSKSGIGKSIQIIHSKLQEYENKLGFYQKQNCLKQTDIYEKIMGILEK